MPKRRSFDSELAALEALRGASPEVAQPVLAQALRLQNSFLVAKAADLMLSHQLKALTPDLAGAFWRFIRDPATQDPQCWATNAIARTLAGFGYQDADLFLAGMRHRRLKYVWGDSNADAASRHLRPCSCSVSRTEKSSGTHLPSSALC